MRRQQVMTRLREHEPELREAGVSGLYLFGSTARDDARDGSDVDCFFDLSEPRGFTLFSLAALAERLEAILGSRVDLMTRAGIHPRRRARIESEAIRVF